MCATPTMPVADTCPSRGLAARSVGVRQTPSGRTEAWQILWVGRQEVVARRLAVRETGDEWEPIPRPTGTTFSGWETLALRPLTRAEAVGLWPVIKAGCLGPWADLR